ncbi:hypothetical protein ABT369_05380 [Dactylosporangium sp. NPDC000244]|uniref:hypothetical protein n=1 Tax=Dactylosporangium sp. NPDC000244 TaxID=3154365 RepID=UPI0033239F69
MTAVDRARTAVARAVKAGDRPAERAARGALATEVLRARLERWLAEGVSVSADQAAQLHTLVDRLVGGPRRVTF